MKYTKILIHKLLATVLLFLLIGGNLVPIKATVINAQETTPTENTQEQTVTETTPEPTVPHENRDQIREEEIARREAEKDAESQKRDAEREAERQARRGDGPTLTPTPTPTTTQTLGVTSSSNTTLESEENTASSDSTDDSNANQSVSNTNSGNVDNNVNTTANTGDNVISGDNPSEDTNTGQDQSPTQSDPIPVCQAELSESADVAGEEDNLLYESSEVNTDENSGATTQDESSLDTNAEDNDSVTVENSNCASIQNDQQVKTNTGENDASDNEGSEMQTGDNSAKSNLTNTANQNVNGANDENNNNTEGSVEDKDNLSVDNNNKIYVENDVTVESKSGGNTLNDNDGQAELSTGDIDMMVTLLNILNTNITGEEFTHLIVNIFGDLTGDVDLDEIASNLGMSEDELSAILRNEQTEQELREKEREEFRARDTDVSNNNEAVVKNNVDVSGVSGQNELSGNEDRTNVLTGRIKILVALVNFINTNYEGTEWYFAMVNIFGSLDGDLVLPDPNGFLVDETSTTTNSLTSDESSESQNTEKVQNTNNVDIKNNIDVVGDSGSNQAYANEDRVEQESGNVDVSTQLLNWLNVNITGNNWVLLVVNVFGNWYGQIVGFPGKDPLSAPESGTLMVAAGANGVGPSIEEGNTTSNENSNVSNTNSASIENNVKIEGISGQNTTNENEDPVSVSTGWVDISADLFNVVNMNVTGKKWMLVMVNIFGDFFGDITFPGVKQESSVEFKAEGELIEEIVPLVGTASDEENSQNVEEKEEEILIAKVNDEPATKIESISNSNDVNHTIEDKVVEIESYTATNTNLIDKNINEEDTNQETKILGVSVDTSETTSQILFLVAVISYLIALRLLAFNKS